VYQLSTTAAVEEITVATIGATATEETVAAVTTTGVAATETTDLAIVGILRP